ncbi:hypothetical protein GQX73_g3706 [Xylaria multiplex]|uniref:MARVEL domain-containing protein n=1 Tax=Xylaria multiplex TaxID=323545 RepID=A0A7C8MWL6_9PEZI|nr:hypothetical protein GQX73_g3706 [Xylaria multiplex]
MYSSNIIILALRVAQFTLAFVVLGLSAYVANWYNVDTMSPPPAQIGWLLFVSLFTIISIGVLEGLPKFAPRFHHPYAALSLEFGNALFYFAGFIALSTFMGRLLFCRGSVCSAARADVARTADEGSPGSLKGDKLAVVSPHYTEIPLSPYRSLWDEEAPPAPEMKAGWRRIYLYLPRRWAGRADEGVYLQ